jgi:hypothetical protein
MDGWMDGYMDGWMGEWMDGWIDRLMAGWMKRQTFNDAASSSDYMPSNSRIQECFD